MNIDEIIENIKKEDFDQESWFIVYDLIYENFYKRASGMTLDEIVFYLKQIK